MLVFQSIGNKLGYLPPWLVFDLIGTYGELRTLRDKYPDPHVLSLGEAGSLVEQVSAVLKRVEGRISTELEVRRSASKCGY